MEIIGLNIPAERIWIPKLLSELSGIFINLLLIYVVYTGSPQKYSAAIDLASALAKADKNIAQIENVTELARNNNRLAVKSMGITSNPTFLMPT